MNAIPKQETPQAVETAEIPGARPDGEVSRRARLAALADSVARLQARYRPPPKQVSSGWAELDAALGGGFRLGALHELVAASAATAACTLALRTAILAADRERWIICFDRFNDWYPPGLEECGVALERLLVLRTQRREETLWALEQTLRCPAVAAVLASPGRLEPLEARRLQLAADTGGGLGLLLHLAPPVRSNNPGTQIAAMQLGEATFAATRLLIAPLPTADARGVRIKLIKAAKAAGTCEMNIMLDRDRTPRGQEKEESLRRPA
ncbi:MAG: hypothetical protein HZB38_09745 [Planctomycetes bacterium]|nr:hypothetical protein [Planctomycetota bacterium]